MGRDLSDPELPARLRGGGRSGDHRARAGAARRGSGRSRSRDGGTRGATARSPLREVRHRHRAVGPDRHRRRVAALPPARRTAGAGTPALPLDHLRRAGRDGGDRARRATPGHHAVPGKARCRRRLADGRRAAGEGPRGGRRRTAGLRGLELRGDAARRDTHRPRRGRARRHARATVRDAGRLCRRQALLRPADEDRRVCPRHRLAAAGTRARLPGRRRAETLQVRRPRRGAPATCACTSVRSFASRTPGARTS